MSEAETNPLSVYRATVIDDWIDYNGHLSEAYYVLLFGFATDAAMDSLGLDAEYRVATGASLYTVEAHARYLREVAGGAEVTVTTVIAGSGVKRLHLAHEMSAAGEVVATEEVLCLYVAGEPAAAAPFPPEIAERIAVSSALSTAEPAWIGRSIGVR